MNTKERIKELCKKNKISVNKLETDLGFGTGYVSKLNKSTPNVKKIKLIADYFHVSVDYLMTGEDNRTDAPVFEPEHIELISLYSQLEKEQKEAVFNLLRSFCSK